MSSQGGDQQGAGSSSWWGWGDTILQTVKKQSETIISIYKEDLSEFTRTIKEDTMSVVKEVVKQEEGAAGSSTSASGEKKRPNAGGSAAATSSSGLSNFFNFMDSLNDEEEEEVLAKSRREKGVKKLQKDINTYTQPPADEEDFKEWKAGFNLEARTVEISQLLSANNKLRAIHNELLPKLTYSVFWERYYYRLEKLLKDEERREKILMRAELDNKLDDWGGWEDDDEGEGEEGVEAATEEAKKDVEEEEEEEREAEQDADNDATNETDAQGEEATAAETATEPAADEPAPVEVAAQHNAAEKSSASAEEVAPVEEEEAAAPQGEEDKNAAEGREVVAGDLPTEDAAPEEEEEENEDDDVLLDVEDSELVPTSPQVGEGDDDWDAWE
jgi:hypothetical protein